MLALSLSGLPWRWICLVRCPADSKEVREDMKLQFADDWSSSSVAFMRLPTQSVNEQQLQASTHRRPSRGLVAPSLFLLSPSGFIPDGVEHWRSFSGANLGHGPPSKMKSYLLSIGILRVCMACWIKVLVQWSQPELWGVFSCTYACEYVTHDH
jgi:hypothetical protein